MRAFGSILALAGFIFLFQIWQIGILALIVSIPFFIPKRFREVDLQKQIHRMGLGLGNYQQGKWKAFPQNVNYISVMRLKQKSTIQTTVGIASMSSTNAYIEYQVNLIYDKRNKFKIGIGVSLEEALDLADKCSANLRQDIFVIQPGKKYWRRYQTSQ